MKTPLITASNGERYAIKLWYCAQVQGSVWHDGRKFVILLIREAEAVAINNDTGDVYDQLKRWKKHFAMILNRMTFGKIPLIVDEIVRNM